MRALFVLPLLAATAFALPTAPTQELSADDFGAFCKGLDELRADYGF